MTAAIAAPPAACRGAAAPVATPEVEAVAVALVEVVGGMTVTTAVAVLVPRVVLIAEVEFVNEVDRVVEL
jgi:hypothetical protein